MVETLEFAKAVGVGIIIIILMGWLFYIIFFVLNKIIKSFKYVFKKWKEEDVKWCMDAIDKDYDTDKVRKYLLLNNNPKKKVAEMVYLFNKCKKKMKGGKNNE